MHCPSCNFANESRARYCDNCGSVLGDPSVLGAPPDSDPIVPGSRRRKPSGKAAPIVISLAATLMTGAVGIGIAAFSLLRGTPAPPPITTIPPNDRATIAEALRDAGMAWVSLRFVDYNNELITDPLTVTVCGKQHPVSGGTFATAVPADGSSCKITVLHQGVRVDDDQEERVLHPGDFMDPPVPIHLSIQR